ncbi:MAG: hypothetical protein ACK4XK_06360 [Casimicrobiaceae bacterium]
MNWAERVEQALARGDLRRAASLAGEWQRAAPEDPVAAHKAADIAFRRFEFMHAERMYRICLARDPARWPAWLNLAFIERLLGRPEGWLEAMRAAIARCPDRALAARLHSSVLVHLHSWPSMSQHTLAAEIRAWAAQHLAPAASRTEATPPPNQAPSPPRPLRVGYVSGNYGGAILSALLPSVLAAHDREVVAPTLVSTSQGLRTAPPVFASTGLPFLAVSAEGMAQMLRGRFDVLVDLDGHTPTGNLPQWTERMAPVQLSWLDWVNTTGTPGMDGYISDAVSTPPELAATFTERVWLLPFFRLPFHVPDWLRQAPTPRASATGGFAFGCFSRLDKLHDSLLASWGRILGAVPGSSLVLKSGLFDAESVRTIFTERLARHGIDRSRLRFLGKTDYRAHLMAYAQVDLVLDSWPYNGGVSTFDALAMGAPVLGLLGETPVGRQTAAILQNCGLHSLRASNVEDYVQRAIDFGLGASALPARASVREALLGSPATDAPRFARALEAIYLQALAESRAT